MVEIAESYYRPLGAPEKRTWREELKAHVFVISQWFKKGVSNILRLDTQEEQSLVDHHQLTDFYSGGYITGWIHVDFKNGEDEALKAMRKSFPNFFVQWLLEEIAELKALCDPDWQVKFIRFKYSYYLGFTPRNGWLNLHFDRDLGEAWRVVRHYSNGPRSTIIDKGYYLHLPTGRHAEMSYSGRDHVPIGQAFALTRNDFHSSVDKPSPANYAHSFYVDLAPNVGAEIEGE